MNVENATAVCVDERARENAHVTRETNQIDIASPQHIRDFVIVFFACAPATLNNKRFNPSLFCFGETGSIRLIADDNRNLRIRNSTSMNRIGQRHHVRTATGDKNAKSSAPSSVHHGSHYLRHDLAKDLAQMVLEMRDIILHQMFESSRRGAIDSLEGNGLQTVFRARLI